MQTFLPEPSFAKSAKALDRARLGKQRLEVFTILRTLRNGRGGWSNHPACKMWEDYPCALAVYGLFVCSEWKSRGYEDNLYPQIHEIRDEYWAKKPKLVLPWWFGDEEFHLSHQSNLVRKMPEHYRVLYPLVPDDLPYVWPIMEEV